MGLNQKGQGVLEMILLMIVGIAFIGALYKVLNESEFLANIVSKPWANVAGMIECGVWKPCGLNSPANNLHPSNRIVSHRPEGQ